MLQGVQLWLNAHMFGKDTSYTSKGLWYAAEWGALRNAALIASVALRAANILDSRADGNGEVVNVRSSRSLDLKSQFVFKSSRGGNSDGCCMCSVLCTRCVIFGVCSKMATALVPDSLAFTHLIETCELVLCRLCGLTMQGALPVSK